MKITLTHLALAILLVACASPEEVKPVLPDANARIKSLCTTGYNWVGGGPSYDNVIIPNIHWKKTMYYFTNDYPATWSASTKPTGGNYVITFRITNTGTATFKFSTKNGAVWQTLTAGQYFQFTKVVPECDIQGQSYTVVFDIYRLSCGTMSLWTRHTAVDSPHMMVYGYGSDFYHVWNAPSCTL